MSLHRNNPKRDGNEPAVVDALERCGWQVKKLSAAGWPDLFCWKGHDQPLMRWVEVKQPKQKLRDSQTWWSGVLPVAILRSVSEVLEWNKHQ